MAMAAGERRLTLCCLGRRASHDKHLQSRLRKRGFALATPAHTSPVSLFVSVIGNIAGGVLTLVGFVLMWSPIPFGIVLLAIGLTVLIGVNAWVRATLRQLRQRYKAVDETLDVVQSRAPGPIRDALARTDPDATEATE